MTSEEKARIIDLRLAGSSYSQIAQEMGKSINTIKSICLRSGCMTETPLPHRENSGLLGACVCRRCGREFKQTPKQKPRSFCNEACRRVWWRENIGLHIKPKAYSHMICQACGKPFQSYGNSHRKFCSHACYIGARYVRTVT